MNKDKISAWLASTRPATLATAVAPVAVGTAVAEQRGGASLLAAAAALGGAVAIQVGTNLANDVFDADKGADTEARIGPRRGLHSGALSRAEVAWGTAAAFGVAALFGLYLAWLGGWPVVAIGLCSIAAGVAYTAGPYALAYLGVADLFVILFYGFVAVAGTTYVQRLYVPALSLWLAWPVGALATAVLVVNNLRDRQEDAQANKRTLAVRFGARFARLEYLGLVASAYAVPFIVVAAGWASPWALLVVLSLPMALRRAHAVWTTDGPALNESLAGTGKLLLAFSALLVAGLLQ